MNEYIIINKADIQKRIEDLEQTLASNERDDGFKTGRLKELYKILCQSNPLIPEIEKAFDAGVAYCASTYEEFMPVHPYKERYVKNLNLNI